MTATRASIPLLLLLPLLGSCSGAPPPDAASSTATAATPDPSRPLPLPLPEVVARVNGQEIVIRQILPLAKAALDKVSAADRDKRKPEMVRKALDDYLTRELLLQEALARGIAADTREVERAYDRVRAEHKGDEEWTSFLSQQGMDPQTLKAELRIQHTISALLAREAQGWPVPESEARAAFEANPRGFGPPGAEPPPTFEAVRSEVESWLRQYKVDEIRVALVARLRARAKIEIYI